MSATHIQNCAYFNSDDMKSQIVQSVGVETSGVDNSSVSEVTTEEILLDKRGSEKFGFQLSDSQSTRVVAIHPNSIASASSLMINDILLLANGQCDADCRT